MMDQRFCPSPPTNATVSDTSRKRQGLIPRPYGIRGGLRHHTRLEFWRRLEFNAPYQ